MLTPAPCLLTQLPRALPAPWQCLRAGQDDQALLRDVFASTKRIELSQLTPDVQLRDVFIGMQMRAQRQSVARYYPDAIEWVVRHHKTAVGRLWLHEDTAGVRIIDITLLPEHQGQGGARTLLHTLMRLADQSGRPLHLHVLADNPIRHWYARLGFALTATSGLYQAMTRLPTVALEQRYEQA